MEFRLDHRKFLVTGASRGIGFAIADALLEEGAKVALVARGKEGISEAEKKFSQRFGQDRIRALSADCSEEDQLLLVRDQLLSEWGEIHGVIANVGDGRSVPDPLPDNAQWTSVWQTNFETALKTTRVFLPVLQQSQGSLLFIASITGLAALGAPVDYSVAKTAVIALAQNLARKVAPTVRVNVIAPGNIFFTGGSWEGKLKANPDEVESMLRQQVPLQRFGTPEEIADAAIFLSSPRASFITGTVLRVDGGQVSSLL
jgi:3-oxoacyl-[acyl-carrier protein] reductase